MNTYEIHTERFGIILKLEDNIDAARRWAKSAFGLGPEAVSRRRESQSCERCDSRPCVCQRR